ncbi:c-type cytochrome [Psychromarinibacter sp. C21-152]|uniref:C-type cytochrome n=1 Tax=Psychromarinibacter sediminicola TaxID=3033385 RepID=A0AAE3T8F2_9RHOB|nr:c-type cytochrome [Psychromarinibacter sediminicola]MDF0600009.1 c-type cytochrome [Psychromarinibacter sediminicola]
MSKFLNLFAPSLGGAAAVLGGAYILADQFVVDMPAPARGELVTPAEAESHAPAAEETAAADSDMAAVETAEAEPEAVAIPEATEAAYEPGPTFGLGREATDEEIAAWDVNVMPDGRGLPEGSGSVLDGETLFVERCAVCHGDFAEGVGNWPSLAGGEGTLADADPVKTVGSYWPYLSTAFDYVHRSMPFGDAQSLTADETYAIVAYILYSNYLVEDDFVLSDENFLDVEMPNADGFIVDDRAETEYPDWRTEPCMENCKDAVEITMRATVLDVTPEEENAEETADDEQMVEEPVTEDSTEEEAAEATAEMAQPEEDEEIDPELVAAGEAAFRKCKACHQVGDGAKNRTGPVLNGVVGRVAGAIEDFRYSNALEDLNEEDFVWTEEHLAAFLEDPRGYIKGNRMSFAGFRDEADIEAVIAYLRTFE